VQTDMQTDIDMETNVDMDVGVKSVYIRAKGLYMYNLPYAYAYALLT